VKEEEYIVETVREIKENQNEEQKAEKNESDAKKLIFSQVGGHK